jgi:NAD-dependent SIR2 family protein deacetylase
VQKAGSKLSEIWHGLGKGIMFKIATPEGWRNNPALVFDFIIKDENSSRSTPNLAHQILVELEAQFDVFIITQNVDDLHERGKENVFACIIESEKYNKSKLHSERRLSFW